jgi:glycosyltransferase involved in cell wall biosynthesis
MLFSVIIPTYNRPQLLRAALESVFAQTFTDYEVIAVDDGSTDETEQVLRSYGQQLRFFRQENSGPGAARNLGMTQARGDYVAFLDSDDIWFRWTLAVFADLILPYNSPTIIAGHLVEFRDVTELSAISEKPPRAEVFVDYFAASRAGYFIGAGMSVLQREELLKSGGYTEQPINAEDHDLILRLGTAAGFIQVLDPPTLGWRRHFAAATADDRRSFDGIRYLVEQERRGAYPGGDARARQRREIITYHARPTSLACLRNEFRKEAWQLYRSTFRWHLGLTRWKYLFGFPILALLNFFKPNPLQRRRS